jgi:hypothetical protein
MVLRGGLHVYAHVRYFCEAEILSSSLSQSTYTHYWLLKQILSAANTMAGFTFPTNLSISSRLDDDRVNTTEVSGSIASEFSCPILDSLENILGLAGLKSHRHIDALHLHLQKGREIRVAEDIRLHLIWHYKIVYVKPLPTYLLKPELWTSTPGPMGNDGRRQALGFIRSYAYLIRHRSDFNIAIEAGLIFPIRDGDSKLGYGDFAKFIKKFEGVQDTEVAPRWKFGQLRLTRLNWLIRIFQPKQAEGGGMCRRLFYYEQYHGTEQFLREFAAPLAFAFGALSLILSAMQVVLAARPDDPWQAFATASAYFSVVIIISLITVVTCLSAVVLIVWFLQVIYFVRHRVVGRLQPAGGVYSSP